MKNKLRMPIFDRRLSLLMALAVAAALCLSVPGITYAHQLNMNFEGDYEFPLPADGGDNPTFHYLQLRTTFYFLAEGVEIPWLSGTKALPTSKNPNDPEWLGLEPI